MTLPNTDREVLVALQQSFDVCPGGARVWDIHGPDTHLREAFVRIAGSLGERGLAVFLASADGMRFEGTITDAGRRFVADQGWVLAELPRPRVNVQIQATPQVKMAIVELDVRGRLVDQWARLLEATLDGADADYEGDRMYANRGWPSVVLQFPPGMSDGDAEAAANDLGSRMLDVLERARRAQSAAVLQDLEATERALGNAKSQLRSFLESATRGTELTTKGAGLLKALHDLGSMLGI